MKVFISWSGRRSKAMAGALKEWLPLILQYAEPWVSDKDINAGDRWAQAIAGELESSNFGILCITPENLDSEWILFEAGALSKSMQDAKVIPLLFGLELSDLKGPLSQFQAIKVEESGMLGVAKAINEVSDNKAADATVEQLVPALWPQLEKKLKAIPAKAGTEKHVRPQTEILEDLVSQVRGFGNRIRELEIDAPDRDERRPVSLKKRLGQVEYVEEVALRIADRSPSGVNFSLVLLAGLVRESFPWLAELLLEVHRELAEAGNGRARELVSSAHEIIEDFAQGPWSELTKSRSGREYEFLRAAHMVLERALEAHYRRKESGQEG